MRRARDLLRSSPSERSFSSCFRIGRINEEVEEKKRFGFGPT